MYCVSCGSRIPAASKTCPTCGKDVRVFGVDAPEEAKSETNDVKEEIKKSTFVPDYFDEVAAPAKARIMSTELDWNLGLHKFVSNYLIWLITLVNVFWGIFFTFGNIEFVEGKFACFIPAYDDGIVLQLMGVAEKSQYPVTTCFRVYGVALIIAALAMLLTLLPMKERKQNAPTGFISVLECFVVAKVLAGIALLVLTSNPMWLLTASLAMAVLNIIYLLIFIPYYKSKEHLFRN
ncbi:MAG: hypothetical protein MJ153_07865 [Clostridia bacterium]|nr:hypothetical protein [Clostridia bacterium]